MSAWQGGFKANDTPADDCGSGFCGVFQTVSAGLSLSAKRTRPEKRNTKGKRNHFEPVAVVSTILWANLA